MKERQAVARELGKGYRQKTKKERGLIVDELVRLTGYNRTYACRALREAGRTGRREPRRRSRRKTYGPEVLVPLRKIWATMDGIAGKRLAPFLPEMVAVMEREGELHLSPRVREKLLKIWSGHHRPSAGSGSQAPYDPRPLAHQAGHPFKTPDPHPHLCLLG